jgi:GT2 family glycosyltransferase
MVIVNYNAGDYLQRCLDSVAEQTYPRWEVIIVDNASQDNSLDSVAEFENLTVIRNEENVGFAAAQNQGIRSARGAYVMPLNFDIEMTPQFLEEMVAAMNLSPAIGIVTGKLRRMRANGERTQELYSVGHVMPLNRFVRHRGAGERDQGQYDYICGVFGAPGAAALYRREMLDDIAFRGEFFDESLFTWYEDVDLDWRAKKLGWKCVYTPKAVAYHVGHPEGHRGDLRQIVLGISNRWLVILANEEVELFCKNLLTLLLYELKTLRYMLVNGYMSAYVGALKSFLRRVPTALAKRRWIMIHKARINEDSVHEK